MLNEYSSPVRLAILKKESQMNKKKGNILACVHEMGVHLAMMKAATKELRSGILDDRLKFLGDNLDLVGKKLREALVAAKMGNSSVVLKALFDEEIEFK